MYSVVMMMAMTGAPETPACHGFLSSLFHCCPSTCYGCYGSCSGCYGGYGGCYGGGYGGYSSWSYGCGGCTGYGIYGGATYSWPLPASGGCSGCYGYGYGVPPNFPYLNTAPKYEEIPPPKKDATKGTTYLPRSSGQARVIVQLPADAKLYADNIQTTLTSGQRTFVTPVLEKGRDFQYQMKVEYQRDGRTVTETKKVVVRADAVVRVDFSESKSVEMASSKVTVALPQGAKLFVDGQEKEIPAQGQFQTPELIKGAEYVYLFKAELNKQAQTQRITFKGGEAVRVDFTDMVNTSSVTQK